MMEPEDPIPAIEDDVVPNHRASSGVTGDKPKTERPGIFTRKATPKARTTPKVPRDEVPNIPGQFVEGIAQTYMMLGMVVMPIRPAMGVAFSENAMQCAVAWDKAAQESPAIRRMLAGGGTFMVVFGLVAAHAPILLAAADGTPVADAMEKFLRQQAEPVAGEE